MWGKIKQEEGSGVICCVVCSVMCGVITTSIIMMVVVLWRSCVHTLCMCGSVPTPPHLASELVAGRRAGKHAAAGVAACMPRAAQCAAASRSSE